MTAQFLLVDNNAYLRLATHAHPKFWGGHPAYELRSVAATEHELSNQRLRTKYVWTNRDPHPSLRKKWQLKVTPGQLKEIVASASTVLEFAEDTLAQAMPHRRKFDADGNEQAFLSPVDLKLLCHALHFDYGLLTDELALTIVANEYGVPVVSSLGLLHYFYSQKLVDLERVEATIQFWHTDNDLPHSGWQADYKRIFKRTPPKVPLAATTRGRTV